LSRRFPIILYLLLSLIATQADENIGIVARADMGMV
jgi:tRNA C32,U32 (ribose-2'-O)-methylase TrmJ